MKQFQYRWKISGREMNGIKNAPDRSALEAHIVKLGGELVEVTAEKHVPDAPVAVRSAPLHPMKPPPSSIYTPSESAKRGLSDPTPQGISEPAQETLVPEKTNLFHPSRRNQKPTRLIQFFGWIAIVIGGLIIAASLLMTIVSLLSGFEWLGENLTIKMKIFLLALFLGMGALKLAAGICMLVYPVFGAWMLLIASLFWLAGCFAAAVKGSLAMALGAILPILLILYLARKRASA